jgi:hypothetical protein
MTDQEQSEKQSSDSFQLNFGILRVNLSGAATRALVPYIGKVLVIVGAGVTIAYLIDAWKN